MAEVAIKVTPVCRSDGGEHYFAELEYRGGSFRVFGPDNHTSSWPTYLEALRVADDYRANRFHKPSDAIMADLERRATEVSPLPSDIEQGLQDLVAWKANR